jgi:hypothetical protein
MAGRIFNGAHREVLWTLTGDCVAQPATANCAPAYQAAIDGLDGVLYRPAMLRALRPPKRTPLSKAVSSPSPAPKAAIAEVNARIDLIEHRLLTRLGGLMVAALHTDEIGG